MRRFLEDARRELAAAFESDTYSRRQHELTEPIEREQEAALAELREHAQAGGIAFELTPTGVMTVPLRGGQPMTPVEFAGLPEPVRSRYQTAIEDLGPPIQAFLVGMHARQREARRRLRALEHRSPCSRASGWPRQRARRFRRTGSTANLGSRPGGVNELLKQIIDSGTEPSGISVVKVETKDVDLPDEMKRAMARQAEAERERRAKVIAAEGEYQAAGVISREHGALALRTLQTLAEVATEHDWTLVFPDPDGYPRRGPRADSQWRPSALAGRSDG